MVSSGPLAVGMICAGLAGLVSFASPCVIPLVPGYLSFLASLVSEEEHTQSTLTSSRKTITATLCFIAGFSTIFLLSTVTLFGMMSLVVLNHRMIQIIGGLITILMALIFLGVFAPLQVNRRFTMPHLTGHLGALVLGAVFAASWTPCLGPTLSSVLALSAGTQGMNAFRGIILIVSYCLGLGVPFLLAAMSSRWAVNTLSLLRRHSHQIHIVSGIILFTVGLLLVCNLWDPCISWLREQWIDDGQVPV